MKLTRIISLLTAFSILSYSCNTYQYYSIEGTLPKSQYSDFFFENDTLQVIYTFNGENGPVFSRIYNKLEEPLYINREQSLDLSYDNNFNKTEFGTKDNNCSEKMEYIAPLSELVTFHTNLNNQILRFFNCRNYTFINKYSPNASYPIRVKEYYFTENDSPIFYRNLITYTNNPENPEQHVIDSKFWVTKIFKSSNDSVLISPDSFRITKKNNLGVKLGIIGIIGFSFLSIVIEPDSQHPQ